MTITSGDNTNLAPSARGKLVTFLDLIKFAHSVFALPFALIATFWASRAIERSWPRAGQLVLIVLCMVVGAHLR